MSSRAARFTHEFRRQGEAVVQAVPMTLGVAGLAWSVSVRGLTQPRVGGAFAFLCFCGAELDDRRNKHHRTAQIERVSSVHTPSWGALVVERSAGWHDAQIVVRLDD
jgi:hypothetical protein